MDAALQRLVVTAFKLHKGHEHQRLAIKDLRLQPDQAGAPQNGFGRIQIAGIKGHHAQALHAPYRSRSQFAGHLVGRQGLIKLAQFKLGAAHDIVGVGVVGVFGDQIGKRAGCRLCLAAVQHRPGHP